MTKKCHYLNIQSLYNFISTLDGELVYPQGISCTLPASLQQELINKIEGLENSQMVKPGYGVEYDFVDPRQILPTLETKILPGLFLAGILNIQKIFLYLVSWFFNPKNYDFNLGLTISYTF